MERNDVRNDKSILIRLRAGVSAPELQVADGTELTVPVQMGRKGLRNLVHHLLELSEEHDEKRPDFHFLAQQKEPLRTTLDKFIAKRGISPESILDLTYYVPLPEPKSNSPSRLSKHWLASVDSRQSKEKSVLLVTGSYGGVPIVSDESGNIVSEVSPSEETHAAPIKGVSWLPGGTAFVTASQDETAKLWQFDQQEGAVSAAGVLHSGDISQPTAFESSAVASSSGKAVVALGGADGSLWLLNDLEETLESVDQDSEHEGRRKSADNVSKRKRRHLADLQAQHLGVTSTDLSVTRIKWNGTNLISAGLDGFVRQWNMVSAAVDVCIPAGAKPITGLAVHSETIAVCGFDGIVRLLDQRDGRGVVASSGKEKSHAGAATDVAWIVPALYLVSGGVDGQVRTWDIRSLSSPTHTVPNVHGENGHSLSLTSENTNGKAITFSVGTDGFLQSFVSET